MMNRFMLCSLVVFAPAVVPSDTSSSAHRSRRAHREPLPIFGCRRWPSRRRPRWFPQTVPAGEPPEASVSSRRCGSLERHDELTALLERQRRALDGRGGMVHGHRRAGCRQDLAAAGVRRRRVPDATPVLWGACDPLSTPRPLGPLHDVAAQLDDARRGGAARRRASARDLRRGVRAPPAAARRSSSSTTCTGPTRAPSTSCASCSAASRRPARWSSARSATTSSTPPTRCGRSSATSPARADAVDAARCQPLSVEAIAALIDDRAGRPGPDRTGSPAATRSSSPRCSTTRATSCRSSVRDAILARTDRPRRRGLGSAPPARLRAGGDPRPPAARPRHRASRRCAPSTTPA